MRERKRKKEDSEKMQTSEGFKERLYEIGWWEERRIGERDKEWVGEIRKADKLKKRVTKRKVKIEEERRERAKQKQIKQCLTHTPTMGEEDNTEAVTVLISKMAAKHLTRVLFLSALSSAISSSLSRSCSRQMFSSLVNTANSCGTNKLRSWSKKTNCLNVWFYKLKWSMHSHLIWNEMKGRKEKFRPHVAKSGDSGEK